MTIKTAEQIAFQVMSEYLAPESETDDQDIQQMIESAVEADRAQRPTRTIHIVFDGPPAHESGRFIETETPDGRGAKVGQWIERPDGYWVLEIEVAE